MFFKTLFVTSFFIVSVSFTAFAVRHIHHPALAAIRTPLLTLADLPVELFRHLKSGLETSRASIPKSVRSKRFWDEVEGAEYYYSKAGYIFHTKEDSPLFDTKIEGNVLRVFWEEGIVYSYYEQSFRKFRRRETDGALEQIWSFEAPYAHHLQGVHVDDTGRIYYPLYFPENIGNEKPNGALKKQYATVLKEDQAPPYDKTFDQYRDDGFGIISPDGKLLYSESLTAIFEASDMAAYIHGSGLEVDPFHLNSVYPAASGVGLVQTGDLLLSLRHMSMVLVYRPSEKLVVLYKVGPWANQHSAKFDEDGNIYLFDNNLIESAYRRRREKDPDALSNRVLRFDPQTGFVTEIVGCSRPNDVQTATGGSVEISGNFMSLSFSNVATEMICNMKTGRFSLRSPNWDDSGRMADSEPRTFLHF